VTAVFVSPDTQPPLVVIARLDRAIQYSRVVGQMLSHSETPWLLDRPVKPRDGGNS
jgi:hypothetical protein